MYELLAGLLTLPCPPRQPHTKFQIEHVNAKRRRLTCFRGNQPKYKYSIYSGVYTISSLSSLYTARRCRSKDLPAQLYTITISLPTPVPKTVSPAVVAACLRIVTWTVATWLHLKYKTKWTSDCFVPIAVLDREYPISGYLLPTQIREVVLRLILRSKLATLKGHHFRHGWLASLYKSTDSVSLVCFLLSGRPLNKTA